MFLRAAGRGFRRIAFAAAVLAAAGPVGALAQLPTVTHASYSYLQTYAYPAAATPNYNYNYQQPTAPSYGYQQPYYPQPYDYPYYYPNYTYPAARSGWSSSSWDWGWSWPWWGCGFAGGFRNSCRFGDGFEGRFGGVRTVRRHTRSAAEQAGDI
jgi:hypothetical protein